jgi:DNA-binding NtrC family response regulator
VEDSENHTLLLLRALRKGGYETVYRRVQTEETMRAALQEEAWDLILSNHNMPRFSVFGSLKVFRESGLDIPFIIVSGAIEEAQVVAAINAGAHDFVLKKNLDCLVPAIQRELLASEKRREHSSDT